MRFFTIFLLFACAIPALNAQTELPIGLTDDERALLKWYNFHEPNLMRGLTDPPATTPRTMAEWEEIQGLVVAWRAYFPTLAEIVRHAREEAHVYIMCENANVVQNALLNNFNFNNLDNITLIETDLNTVWMRDYGPNTVYMNDVDSLSIVEWIYNRPRPADDMVPDVLGNELDIPVYSTTAAPNDLVHTGGNFTADGLGTAFSSELVLEENDMNNPYGATVKNEADIDAIMQTWMGIDRYIKMPTLPYDGIHHIDMHMRLMDEETILMGEYPAGVADGPQIEANLQYVLNNFDSPFGTPYRVQRIQMPPDNGQYPDGAWWADYRTYTNSVFVNGTILVPIYEETFDSTALRIYRELMPGYNVVGIDCNDIIEAGGALHCITRAIGVDDPLWIVHQRQPDVDDPTGADFTISADIKHRSGVDDVFLHYTTDTLLGYTATPMFLEDNAAGTYTATIPFNPAATEYFYYIDAVAISGKQTMRPLPAPTAYYRFTVNTTVDTQEPLPNATFDEIFPNPARALTCVPLQLTEATMATLTVQNALGQTVETLFTGRLSVGEQKFFLDAATYDAGIHTVTLRTAAGSFSRKLVVR